MIGSPHGSKVAKPYLKVFLRMWDRGSVCNKEIKIEVENPDDNSQIDVKTKKVLFNDIKKLYTGDIISSHYVYA